LHHLATAKKGGDSAIFMKNPKNQLNIAVIGAGISGITAADLLQANHRVDLYEKNDYFGGHTNTVVIPSGPDAGTPVDTGFIVLNEKTYPNFIRFLRQHDVETEKTDMTFSYYEPENGFCYATQNLSALFAQTSNFFKPWYWRFLFEIKRFLLTTKADFYSGNLEGLTLGQYLHRHQYSHHLIHRFIIPWSAAIWSAADVRMMGFPMKTFAQFYENHGLLSVKKEVAWYFVKGGSQTYVRAFLKSFQGNTFNKSPVTGIKRDERVTVTLADGTRKPYDKVVIATHADEALSLLEDPSEDETRLLGAWKYSQNQVVLHTDTAWMPKNPRSWAAWNYIRMPESDATSPITLTYHMNRLQNLKTRHEYLVTLNPPGSIGEQHVIEKIHYAHPIYSFDAFASQNGLSALNGKNHTYYCGSYFGYGFHEDGVKSAVAVGNHLGVQ
jgi:predicted NAD/FAD-binding protein